MMWPIYNLEIQVPIVSGSSNEFVTEGREKGASWSGQVFIQFYDLEKHGIILRAIINLAI